MLDVDKTPHFDNDSRRFAVPHGDALDVQKSEAVVRAIDSAIAIAIAIAIDSDSAEDFANVFNSPEFATLPAQLQQMAETIPTDADPDQAWQDWANKLEAIWFDVLGLDRAALTFNKAEAEALRDYFYATELLLRCKDAAVRISKQAWADLEVRLLTV
ncbi:MAG: hypothetical protein ACFB0C_16020 [Leptolyngbyaceae cyanobacterium]